MSRPPLHRPILLPGLPRIWRGANTLQLGLHPSRAVLIDFPDAATAKLLDLLDGTRPEKTVLQGADALGISPAEARTLLNLLHEAGLVISSQNLFPPALDAQTRRLLSSEAASLALASQIILTARVIQFPPSGDACPADVPAEHTASGPASLADDPGQITHSDHVDLASRPELSERFHSAAQATPESDGRSVRDGLEGRGARGARASQSRHRDRVAETVSGEPDDELLFPAAILRRRRSARIVIAGRGRLGSGIAVALAEAGVGHVYADLPGTVNHLDRIGGPLRGAKEGSVRARAVTEAIREVSPTTQTHSIRRGTATLVVQLTHDEPTALLALAHEQHRQPYLAISVREGSAVIGPLVPAGGQPCLNCLALHRHLGGPGLPEPGPDHPGHPPGYLEHRPELSEPGPRLPEPGRGSASGPRPTHGPGSADGPGSAQQPAQTCLGAAPPVAPDEFGPVETRHGSLRHQDLRVEDEPLAVATVLTACGYAVGQVLKFIDGEVPETVGAEVEIDTPTRIHRRRWAPHPYCTCGHTRGEP